MIGDPRAILRQLARTTLLVAAGAAVILAVVGLVAAVPQGRWLVVLLLAGPMAGLLAFVVADALRSGVFPERFRAVERARHPLVYWSGIGWFAAAALFMAGLAAWSATELMMAVLDGG